MNAQVYVISTGRAGNVPAMHRMVEGYTPIWVTRPEDAAAYKEAGAQFLLHADSLTAQRNAALDDAFRDGAACVQTDDDLRGLAWAVDTKTTEPLRFTDMLDVFRLTLFETGLKLAGAAPTTNPYFARSDLSTDLFIRSGITYTLPSAPRYDTALKLKEDYDFVLQHITGYGGAARCNRVLANFQQRTNVGGAVDYRTPEEEERAVRYLLRKWPGLVKRHPTREHEVSLTVPRAGRTTLT